MQTYSWTCFYLNEQTGSSIFFDVGVRPERVPAGWCWCVTLYVAVPVRINCYVSGFHNTNQFVIVVNS